MDRAPISTQAEIPAELPGDDPEDVLFDTIYGVRTIELNRPSKLNSLNGSMARKILPRLKEWEKSQMANVVIIKGAGAKAFCAGGDVAALAKYVKNEAVEGQQKAREYFGLEYKLDHLIATYAKPYVAFMDGITMGGGVGLSVHAPFRIATERTVFAMPETTIGFFPDVGASFFLPRLDGMVGTYLALTSQQLKGVNVFYTGIATHYIHSSSLADLQARLAELKFKDYASLQQRYEIINHTIGEFFTGLPHDEPMQLAGETREAIDRCFKFDTIRQVLAALEQEKSEWASETLNTLQERSPTSLRVALHQMRVGRQWSIAEVFEREHAIASQFIEHEDFVNGVTARLIDKPKTEPKWVSVDENTTDASVVKPFFDTEGKERLQLLDQGDRTSYRDYPHAWLGLPRETDVERIVREGDKTSEEVLAYFDVLKNEKPGTREKVEEILARKTTKDSVSNTLAWKS
ncbi:MAG: hypothetical protein M1835_007720 [Candelina submexicana]|nr:MAG: hypothetical protein M1835_007720 [Candelina submexicana]